MDIHRMVESIVRELLKQAAPEPVKPQKLLYVFGDAKAHEAYSDHFITLNNNGIQHDSLFLDGVASAWLGRQRIESSGTGRAIAMDEFAPSPLELPLMYDGVVIPEIDLDSAGRITLGMKGTVTSELVFAALVTNKFVLVGDDVSGLNRPDRRTLKSLTLPGPFMKLFDYYKQEMRMYGVEFGAQNELAELAVRKCTERRSPDRNDLAVRADGIGDADLAASDTVVTFEGKLLSADWVERQLTTRGKGKGKPVAGITGVKLHQGTIVSPLAKDRLRELGIALYAAEGR